MPPRARAGAQGDARPRSHDRSGGGLGDGERNHHPPSHAGRRRPRRRPRSAGFVGVIRDYIALTKPRIISLLLLTTVTTMFVADPSGPSLSVILWTMLGGYLAAGGAGAINHYLDRERDARMSRTCGRPLVAGRIEPIHGLIFGIVLGVLATVQLALTVNALAAVLSLAGLLGYAFVYTVWLKPLTPQNIVIGGAAGAMPPLVGWAAATGGLTLGGADPVRDRLPLDAAALLGAVAADQGRLRAHRRADAARGPRRGRHAAPDPRLLRCSSSRSRCCPCADRPLRRRLPRSPRSCWASASSPSRPPPGDARRKAALRVYLSSLAYLALLFIAMALDAAL